MAEVIGHGLDEELGVSCIFVYPLAAQQREVLDWAICNLAAPNSLHLCRRPAASCPARLPLQRGAGRHLRGGVAHAAELRA